MRALFRDWQFEVDRKLTENIYKSVSFGSAESCGCDYCKNFAFQRASIYPIEIKELFQMLGIDYCKEADVTEYAEIENNCHLYGGWFHFIGRLLQGKNCEVPLQAGGFTFDLTPIENSFEIGFRQSNDLSFFPKDTSLVQVEFEVKLPWLIYSK